MIGVAFAFIVLGVILFFLYFPVGIAVGIIGLILAILYIAGIGRRAAQPRA